MKKLFGMIAFLAAMAATTLGLHWYNGYDAAKRAGTATSYRSYVAEQVKVLRGGLGELPRAVGAIGESTDEALIGAMRTLEQALEIYNIDMGEYPQRIEDLVGDYLNERSIILKQESFYYERTFRGGYEAGIELPASGEWYVIEQKS